MIKGVLKVEVAAAPPAETLVTEATVAGGGATAVRTTAPTKISADPLAFDFLPGDAGFSARLGEPDGSAAELAASHPYQLTVDVGFPTEEPPGGLTGAGHFRDVLTDLPPGLIGDPTATPVLCTEAELVTSDEPGCPEASQVGTATVTTTLGSGTTPIFTGNLYNMVPPPGSPAELAFEAVDSGIYVHLLASVRSDGDYGITTATNDILALGGNPLFNVQAQIWGDPSSSAHDHIRGTCKFSGASCPVSPQQTAFLTLPGDCPAGAPTLTAHADSWEEPGLFHQRSYAAADPEGNPAPISGCNQLSFEPTLSVRPSTNVADSPSGLDVDLHQPQDTDKEARATAALRDASVTLPAGMAVNPSQADGLAACSQAQIGYLGEGHYSRAPSSCPDGAKLGTLEVTTPLLARYKPGGTEPELDPETGLPIPRPLPTPGEGLGAVYLAKPYENQFGSLLAIYLVLEDPHSGTVAKLAGRVEPDPHTGQLTTRFAENPQLPLEDVKLHLFSGARASLITPPTCATHTTSSDLTPWSAPEGLDAHPPTPSRSPPPPTVVPARRARRRQPTGPPSAPAPSPRLQAPTRPSS